MTFDDFDAFLMTFIAMFLLQLHVHTRISRTCNPVTVIQCCGVRRVLVGNSSGLNSV